MRQWVYAISSWYRFYVSNWNQILFLYISFVFVIVNNRNAAHFSLDNRNMSFWLKQEWHSKKKMIQTENKLEFVSDILSYYNKLRVSLKKSHRSFGQVKNRCKTKTMIHSFYKIEKKFWCFYNLIFIFLFYLFIKTITTIKQGSFISLTHFPKSFLIEIEKR